MATDTAQAQAPVESAQSADPGLFALGLIAGYYRIAIDAQQLSYQLGLTGQNAKAEDILRAANLVGLKARIVRAVDAKRLARLPLPFIVGAADGGYAVVAPGQTRGVLRYVDVPRRISREGPAEEILGLTSGEVVLVALRIGGAGTDPKTFGFSWFLPSLYRYRRPLAQVLLASLFIQLFALATPIFFQLVVDKVLVHKGMSTLVVLVIGLACMGLFETALQYLRAHTLSHTTNRIDVELGRRLFHHLFRLPLAYFETRPAGQTVARMRELETVRSFLTGHGLMSLIDLLFVIIFIGVLLLYSPKLTLIVLGSVPVFILIAVTIRPLLRDKIDEKFNRGARSHQFLVEAIVGSNTIKAAGVEPMVQIQWEERLAAYVRTSFDASMLSALGQGLIQYVSKASTALILFVGAQAVIGGELTVGELVAFNMIAGQAVQPILRLSQLWQDFQQVQISVARMGDILNAPAEPVPTNMLAMPPLRGGIDLNGISFRYRMDGADVLRNVSLSIAPGEVIGIVGASGSGKSTLAKLIQRLHSPQTGQVLLDGVDIAQLDPGWLRRQIGVVLQESILFNRTIHENIALGNPAMARARVIHVARLAGADEFIAKMPQGYNTQIEERGSNLSGGQRQRLAIARALAANPRILILDEATSALDYESERIVQENMRAIVRGRTVIIVAHRLAAVRTCDRIIGMRDGQIVEAGTHAELLASKDGLYARLWALQTQSEHAGVDG